MSSSSIIGNPGGSPSPSTTIGIGAGLGFSGGNLIATFAPTSADATGQTAANTNVLTVTSPNDGNNHQYSIGGYINITAISIDVLQFQCRYTDENNVSQTLTFFPMGVTSANLATTGPYSFPDTTIRVAPNTTIVFKVAVTVGGGTVTYDVGCWATKVN
jgi:hypothetical protein